MIRDFMTEKRSLLSRYGNKTKWGMFSQNLSIGFLFLDEVKTR